MNRGDVVLVDWAYSDLTGTKLRPAVVVQADFLNGLIDDTVLVQMHAARHRRHGGWNRPGAGNSRFCRGSFTVEEARRQDRDLTLGPYAIQVWK